MENFLLEIGGKSKTELIDELSNCKISLNHYGQDILESKDFNVLEAPTKVSLVRLKVKDLLLDSPTTNEIYARIVELGLELCTAEIGLYYRLAYTNQLEGERLIVGMKQIVGRDEKPLAFYLERRVDGLWLRGYWAGPTYKWNSEEEFVFCLRKSEI